VPFEDYYLVMMMMMMMMMMICLFLPLPLPLPPLPHPLPAVDCLYHHCRRMRWAEGYCLVVVVMMMMMMMMIHLLPPLPPPLPPLQHPLPPVDCLCHHWRRMRWEDCHFLHMPPRWDSLMMADLTW